MIRASRSPNMVLAGMFLAAILLVLPRAGLPEGIQEGATTPEWTAADMAGVNRSIKDHIGKQVVLLDYWSIYCVSCVQQMPSLADLYNKYKDQGLMVYGIDLDTFSPKRVQKFIDGLDWKIPYPIIIDGKRDIANAYKVSMLPSTVVIGKDGKIKLFHVGYKPGDEKDIEEKVKSFLK